MKKALVIGLGISGKAVCGFLQKRGYQVTGADSRAVSIEGVRTISDREEISMDDFDLIVPSPGIAWDHPFYREALELGLPIVGEAQLALSELSQPMIAITGTNGKTTVTMLATHALLTSGRSARSLGNIGDALAAYALEPNPEETLVIELSSYQLETLKGPFFDAGVILNITPDHLDRYQTMQSYAQAKWRLQHCLKEGKKLFVYEEAMKEFGDFAEIKEIEVYGKSPTHDQENNEAAWLLVRELGVTKEEFSKALSTFKKPHHRIEYLGTIRGVRYYDDSKGTNIDAVIRAVGMMQGPIWLIAGGVDKGASYTVWKPAFAGKVRKIFALGQAKRKIAEEAGEFCLVEEVDSLESAVKKAAQEAVADGNVLLSPGCSSFDMFQDYAHRGREFQRFVNQFREGFKEEP